jgi:two-component system, chemotaxis family, chemotaxis protein CheY
MKSVETLLKQLDDPSLTYDEQAQLRCRIAAELEHKGQYEDARDMLAELWQGIGERPALVGLIEPTAAEVLLRVGTLSGWYGSVRQTEGAQEAAKDLISESITRFQALGAIVKAVAAQYELGFCYWRAGALDEARLIYTEALKNLADRDSELKAKILIRLAIVESCSGRNNDALRILIDATPMFEESISPALKGKFHNELALVLRKLGTGEHRADYTDRAILEYTAAAYHFEQAGHTGYSASAENNLGFLLYTMGRYDEAHQHLKRARRLFASVKDSGRIAQVDDAHARVLLAEGKAREAAKVISEAVRTLAKGGEQGLLAEALTTQGRVLAQLRDVPASLDRFRRAADLAEQAGAVEDAGRALLALIEEHAERLTEQELFEAYERADDLLKDTQDAETIARLRSCARGIVGVRRAAAMPVRHSRVDFWANFSLAEKVRAYEARYIRRALHDARGSISRAARLLGLKHHASLTSLLKGRHKGLTHLRTPPEKRTPRIARLRSLRHTPKAQTGKSSRAVRILHVEDNKLVATLVQETLELEGWSVLTINEGRAALQHVAGGTRFDLLLLDNELPGLNGIELVRAARRHVERRRTPIIMLSASDVRAEAERAGVDVFLRKPEEIGKLVETVERLLTRRASF